MITGIHHITALASDPQRNIDFYTGILGLRFIKKTVNFDVPDVYHFYYGNETGDPGTALTFFPYNEIMKGKNGSGMAGTIGFSVPSGSEEYWEDRFNRYDVKHDSPRQRFVNETYIHFEDHDGQQLELVFNDKDKRKAYTYGHVPLKHSIKGFFHAELLEYDSKATVSLLTGALNHSLIAVEDNRLRYATKDAPGHYIDIIELSSFEHGIGGAGTVHHIAFATPESLSQHEVRSKLTIEGFNPTEVIDRQHY